MRAVREAFPHAELVLMTANDGAGIVWTDEVLRDFRLVRARRHVSGARARDVPRPRRRPRRVRAVRPELVVYLGSDHNSGLRTWRDRLFFRLAGAGRFVAASSTKVSFFGRLRRERRE